MTFKDELDAIERAKFESLDWNKPTTALAAETGMPWQNLNQWRKKLGKPKATKWYPACLSWNWDRSNGELMREHGCHWNSVRQLRDLHGMPYANGILNDRPVIPKPPRAERRKVDWAMVDWTKTDVEPAETADCCREYIRQKRLQLNQPRPPMKWRLRKFIRFAEYFKGRTQLTHKEACEFERLSLATFRGYCHELGITIPHNPFYGCQIHPWHIIDMSLPNILIAEIWKASSPSVATHRSKHMKHGPLFKCVRGRVPEQFITLVEAERAKAADWFNTKPTMPRAALLGALDKLKGELQ